MGQLGTGEKILIGAGVIGLPVVVVIAVAGGADQQAKPPAVVVASRSAQAVPATHAVPSSPAPQRSAQRPAADIDQSGDDGTPCVVTYAPTGDGRGTLLRATLTATGDLIAHLDGPSGLMRHEKQSGPGQLQFTDQVPLNQVSGAGAVLQGADETRHVCAIRAAG